MPPASSTPAQDQTQDQAPDVSGRLLTKGDTVSSLNGQMTGRVWEIQRDDDEAFVSVRPLHQPYAPATWYAADQLIWVATPGSGSSTDKAKEKAKSEARNKAKADEFAKSTAKSTKKAKKTAKKTPKSKK